LSLLLNEIFKSYLEFWPIRTALIALSDRLFITNNENVDAMNISSVVNLRAKAINARSTSITILLD